MDQERTDSPFDHRTPILPPGPAPALWQIGGHESGDSGGGSSRSSC
jgi:hypothetical protein